MGTVYVVVEYDQSNTIVRGICSSRQKAAAMKKAIQDRSHRAGRGEVHLQTMCKEVDSNPEAIHYEWEEEFALPVETLVGCPFTRKDPCYCRYCKSE